MSSQIRNTSMSFHVNPKTGNPGACRAKEGKCPFGDESEHFDSKAEAAAYFEEQQVAGAGSLKKWKPKGYIDPASGFLTEEAIAKIEVRDVYCPHCNAELKDPQKAGRLVDGDFSEIECECGGAYNIENAVIKLSPENPSHKFFEKKAVKEAVWYHSTGDDQWIKGIDEHFEAHVGTEAAAMDRAIAEHASHAGWGHDFYMFEVKLAKSARIAEEVIEDENKSNLVKEKADVIRYINRWEDTASISLAVKTNKLEIVGMRKVTLEEAHEHLSVYNVKPDDY